MLLRVGLFDNVRYADTLPVGHGNGHLTHLTSLWSNPSHPKDLHL